MLKRDELANPNSCLNRARDDEYVFVLLERDDATADTIRDWAAKRVRKGKNVWDDRQISEALTAALKIEAAKGVLDGALYRVMGGSCAGALVRAHFINSSGNADCRFAEAFGSLAAGEIVVVRPDNLWPERADAPTRA